MTTGQEQPVSFYCPRCGGAMYKPAGSPFYWHTNSNHPRCNITNLADNTSSASSTKMVPSTDELPKSSIGQTKKKLS